MSAAHRLLPPVCLLLAVAACDPPRAPPGDVELGESYVETCNCGPGGLLTSIELLVGVNRQVALSTLFEPALVQVAPTYGWGFQRLRPLAAGYFMDLADAALVGIGRDLFAGSAYRSYCTQCNLFAAYAATFGEEEANTFSARAGHSEHQLGTTTDLFVNGHFVGGPYDIPGTALADPTLYQWLDENAWQHGYVNSYPPNDADGGDRFASRTFQVTGYIPEPWHWRFIGKRAAFVHRRLTGRVGFRVSTHELIAALHDAGHELADDLAAVMAELGYLPSDLEAPHPDDAAALDRASGGAPPPPGCASSTLGRTVASGECVQVSYASCGLDTCAWFRCDGGQWTCAATDSCSAAQHPHATCQ